MKQSLVNETVWHSLEMCITHETHSISMQTLSIPLLINEN